MSSAAAPPFGDSPSEGAAAAAPGPSTSTDAAATTPPVPAVAPAPVAATAASPLPPPPSSFDFDLVVLGGGSGGLSCSKEAAKLGAKVACLDFVKPTPLGTEWGLGGTCVNVGCIPKKLMHTASLLSHSFSDARAFGWDLPAENPTLKWDKLVQGVQDHIGSLNWGYRVALRDASVKYINAYGRFLDPYTLECTDRRGKVSHITASKFVIAVGGRPKYPGLPGDKELCVTSDDIFSLPHSPGRTLCIGASYISLETAGFLAGLGLPVTVMARSIFLRGFDQEIAEHIAGYMGRHGISYIRPAVPVRFDKDPSGGVCVTFSRLSQSSDGQPAEAVEEKQTFDTVVLAIGRDALTKDLNLDSAGVQVNPANGKILAENEQTSAPHIFAIGDVLDTRQELTPVAIKAGILLARRLYGGGARQMDYNLVPTTVFTPLEYGCCGMAEEDAVARHGSENVKVYRSYFRPLEWQVNHEMEEDGVTPVREDNVCYAKLITHVPDDERVLGLHVVGPNAGEITQGFAVAMHMGATKNDFDSTIGIHPTVAEEMVLLRVTRGSTESPFKTGC